jgi:hypothetical protein
MLVNFMRLKFLYICGKEMDLKMGHQERFLMTIWSIPTFIYREQQLTAPVLLAAVLYGATPQGIYLLFLKFNYVCNLP